MTTVSKGRERYEDMHRPPEKRTPNNAVKALLEKRREAGAFDVQTGEAGTDVQ